MGTPGQAFNMIFDSGSSDIFVPTDPAVTTQAKFKPSASSTLAVSTVPWSITYGTGSSKGE